MITIIKKMTYNYLNKNFILFIFCGGAGTIVNFFVSMALSQFINPLLSYVCGYCISLFLSYYLNAHLIYREKCILVKFIKFIVSYIPNFILLFSFVYIFINRFSWNKDIVYLLAGVIGIPITYLIVKLYAFGKEE
jgi:putative flippase GtrA